MYLSNTVQNYERRREQRRDTTETEKPDLMNLLKQTGWVVTYVWLQMAALSIAISHIEHDLAATIIPPTCLFHPGLSLTDCLFPPLVCPILAIWLLTMWCYKGWGQGPQQQRSAHCLWIKTLEECGILGRRGIVSIYRLSVWMLWSWVTNPVWRIGHEWRSLIWNAHNRQYISRCCLS